MANTLCMDKRPCFARQDILTRGRCKILNDSSSYAPGECPFCKPKASVTNGVEYPFDRHYAPKEQG